MNNFNKGSIVRLLGVGVSYILKNSRTSTMGCPRTALYRLPIDYFSIAATPGNTLPSIASRRAPPPVEI